MAEMAGVFESLASLIESPDTGCPDDGRPLWAVSPRGILPALTDEDSAGGHAAGGRLARPTCPWG